MKKTTSTATAQKPIFLQSFFQKIESRLGSSETLASVLEEHLSISKGNAYKRLRGDKPLTINELFILAKVYNISLDEWIFNNKGRVTMDFMPLVRPIQHPVEFLRSIHYLLEQASKLPDLLVHYATVEMAGFQYLVFPELTAFKFHMWNRTTWEIDAYNQPLFSPKRYTEDTELENARLAFLKLWNQTPTCEYWQLHMLENTLSQLHFMAYEDSFEQPEVAVLICQQILELIDMWEKMADTGRKPQTIGADGVAQPQAAFTLYHNEIFHTNNIFLLESPIRQRVVMTLDNPNSITTENEALCTYITSFFKKIRTRSQRISEEGEKQRHRFFSILRTKVLVTSTEINTLLKM